MKRIIICTIRFSHENEYNNLNARSLFPPNKIKASFCAYLLICIYTRFTESVIGLCLARLGDISAQCFMERDLINTWLES